ncbi:MAG: pectinesterase family protein [Actinopolymorphaceae bacterium]
MPTNLALVTPEGMIRSPADGATDVSPDTPLRMTFAGPPRLGDRGTIRVHSSDGRLADSIDLADPASFRRTVGDAESDTGALHWFHYLPVTVDGCTVTAHLHRQLDYGESYDVTVDPDVVPGHRHPPWRFTTRPAPPTVDTGTDADAGAGATAAVLTVAADGSGDFITVQGAVDAVPRGNDRPVLIDVRPGVYTEIVYVRPDKPYITVRGADRERTVIAYANNDLRNGQPSDSRCPRRYLDVPDRYNCWRATFGVEAPDFTLENITVHNTTPAGGSQAEAFRGNNDRILLNRVTLRSYQDTLRLQGSGCVTHSLIEGDVDVVWGVGTVVVHETEIRSLRPGYVTQARNGTNRRGNVFVKCRLTRAPDVPDGSCYLARTDLTAYPASQAVFLDTAMDTHIHPLGWKVTRRGVPGGPSDLGAWTRELRFWEHHSTDLDGAPLDLDERAPCSRLLGDSDAARWRDPAFVLGGWAPAALDGTNDSRLP